MSAWYFSGNKLYFLSARSSGGTFFDVVRNREPAYRELMKNA